MVCYSPLIFLQIWSTVKAFGIMWVDCECCKNPLFEGVRPAPVGDFVVLNKNSTGVELFLGRLS